MRFEKLRLSGFKSFVEPAELRIEPGLTGLVGPNGCGKSNLLEALRWVMGEHSPKSMRGGGMDDVIFAGTAQRPPRDFAEVVLTARGDGPDPLAPAPLPAANDPGDGAELEIARRIERGAGSAYRVNGRDVRARNIALIFADAATGAHSPALVGQGRIAAVIAAKPGERRMMLEEAAGIAGLHVRRRDAEAKLRATEGNLTRLADLLAGLEGQIAGLRRQARAAERYRALSERIRLAEARLVVARWSEAAEAAEAAAREAAEAQAAVASAQAATHQAQAAQQASAAALASARDAVAGRREEASAHAGRMAALAGRLEAARQRLADLDRQLARIDAELAANERLTGDAAGALARLALDAAEVERTVAEDEAARPVLAATAEQAERAAQAAELALARAIADQAGVEAEWRVARAAEASAAAQLERLAGEQARLDTLAAALTAEGDRDQPVHAAERQRAEAGARLAQARTERDALAARRTALTLARDSANDALAGARAAAAGKEREAEALARERAARTPRGAGGRSALDAVRAAPGYERALAAVLGSDARATLGAAGEGVEGRFWTGAAAPAALADSLVEHVAALPPELAARLARVRFAEREDGRALAPGEWLVTRAGRLRRWDGLVAFGEGAAAAAELEAVNRLAALEAELPDLRRQRDRAAQEAHDAAATLGQTQSALAAAEQALGAAAEAERAALRALDHAEAARERAQGRAGELAIARAALGERLAAGRTALEAAVAARAALSDPEQARAPVEQARSRHAAGRSALQAAQAALSGLDARLATARERRAGLRGDIRSWQARAGDAELRLVDIARTRDELAGERAVIAARPAALAGELAGSEAQQARLAADLTAAEALLAERQRAATVCADALAALAEQLAAARENRAGADARAESHQSRREEATRVAGERFQCPPPLLAERFGFRAAELSPPGDEGAAHDRLVADRERLGPVNLVAAEELAAAVSQHRENAAEQAELAEAVHRLRGSIGSLNREGRERLRAAFDAVDGHFRRLFTGLFEGGQAHLALVDSDDPLEAGLEIYAQPPGKRLQSLTLLSGGEQALTAVALIFALFLTNPAPICVLDEVDAPLDDANIERFCDLLDTMVAITATRYLIVTHNAVTMSRMHRLFGVTMVEQGVSRLVSVDLGGAEQLLAAE